MKLSWKSLLHFLIGFAAAGLAVVPAGGPITARTVLLPALASAITSVAAVIHGNTTTNP